MRLPALLRLAPLGMLPVWACGPQIELAETTEASSTATNDDSGPPGTMSSAHDTTTTISDGPGDTTALVTETDEPPGGYEDDDGGTGCTFTCPDPPAPPGGGGGGGGGGGVACDLLAQDCPEGEKCMPQDTVGDGVWNTTRCIALYSDPGQPGDACEVEGHPAWGIDDCDLGVLCWNVDLETNYGVCHALCLGEAPSCTEEQTCMLVAGLVPLCVDRCNPLLSGCDEGRACLPSSTAFACLPHDGSGAALGEPCDAPNACEAGSLCAFDPAVTCGNMPGQGCCAAPCDVNAPGLCGGPMSTCVPWFPLRPPLDLADLGVCAIP